MAETAVSLSRLKKAQSFLIFFHRLPQDSGGGDEKLVQSSDSDVLRQSIIVQEINQILSSDLLQVDFLADEIAQFQNCKKKIQQDGMKWLEQGLETGVCNLVFM